MLTDEQVESIWQHIHSLEKNTRRPEVVQHVREYELHGVEGQNTMGIIGKYIGRCVDCIRQGRSL